MLLPSSSVRYMLPQSVTEVSQTWKGRRKIHHISCASKYASRTYQYSIGAPLLFSSSSPLSGKRRGGKRCLLLCDHISPDGKHHREGKRRRGRERERRERTQQAHESEQTRSAFVHARPKKEKEGRERRSMNIQTESDLSIDFLAFDSAAERARWDDNWTPCLLFLLFTSSFSFSQGGGKRLDFHFFMAWFLLLASLLEGQ